MTGKNVDAELRMEDGVPLIPIPRNKNSNTDDLAINLDTPKFHWEISQHDLGNTKIQIGLQTSVDM